MQWKLTPEMTAAICYADIFDFPLTKEELRTFSIKVSAKKIVDAKIMSANGYYFLKGRNKIIALRKKRKIFSKEKLEIARNISRILFYIPTIQMIAVTGALAMENCDREDDIDLLIVSKPGTIWTTRFLCIIFLELLRKRRRPNEHHSSNKICMNMFLDTNHLQVPQKEQDVFSAHEAAQVKILCSRGEVEQKYWSENKWVKKFLPNYPINKEMTLSKQNHSSDFHFGEALLRQFQLRYMKSKRTTEVIKEGYLRFHPKDARNWVIPEYEKRLAMAGLK